MNQTIPIISEKPTYILKRCTSSKIKRNKHARSTPIQETVKNSPNGKRAKNDFNLSTSLITELALEANKITKMISENAVMVFGRHGCCLCHVVKQLLQSLGANPVVHEIEDAEIIYSYFDEKFKDISQQFPAVFIGGEMYGGLDRVIATHISGELVPLLKQAGALWL